MSLATIRKHVKELAQVVSGESDVESFSMTTREVKIETRSKLLVITEKDKSQS